jgi:steroid 5-alpha reductase family enzyme
MADFPWGSFAASLPFTLLAVLLVLGSTFVVALRVGRHAVVDVAWGLGFVAVAVASFVASDGEGDDVRRTLVLLLTAAWGVRLAGHIALRSRGHGEDPRYVELMAKAPGHPHLFAFRKVYLTQGAVMWFVSLPVQVAAFETTGPTWLTWLGVAVWAVGLGFESVGDLQLTRFRNDPASRGQVLDTGLWRFTRHPNYFGDACAWWGISLVASSAWPGILTILSPLAMTWFLAAGTGKPLLEKDMASRRPGYADYVRRTSGFVPLPPRKPAPSTSTSNPTSTPSQETL